MLHSDSLISILFHNTKYDYKFIMLFLCVVFLLMLYWSKDCKKRHKRKKISSEQTFLFVFQALQVTFLILRLESFISQNMRNFCFSDFANSLLKYKSIFLNLRLESSISRNIRNCLILELESSIYWKLLFPEI